MAASGFYKHLSPKSQAKFYTAIFFYFAPMFLLTVSLFDDRYSWWMIVLMMVGSGIIAVGYAFASIRNTRLLAIVIPLHALIGTGLGILSGGPALQFSILGLACVAVSVLGYVLFISFINGEGARNLRLQTEIDLASQLHAHLVPRIDIANPRIEVCGEASSSTEVGGDLIDVVETSDGMNLFIADVSGHGMKAGVTMSMVKSAIRMKLLHSQLLDHLCNDLNTVVRQVKRPEVFVTFACLQITPDRTVRYVNAGHPQVLHYKASTKRIDELSSRAPGLGLMSGFTYAIQSLKAEAGDIFILLTDGLLESKNQSGDEFGLERIKGIVAANASSSLDLLRATIFSSTSAFGKKEDDQTLLLARVR